MKKVAIELPDNYASVLTVTAIGRENGVVINVTTAAFDLDKGTQLVYTDGSWIQGEGAADGKSGT